MNCDARELKRVVVQSVLSVLARSHNATEVLAKCLHPVLLSSQSSIIDLQADMKFFFRREEAFKWKNFELQSPSLSHRNANVGATCIFQPQLGQGTKFSDVCKKWIPPEIGPCCPSQYLIGRLIRWRWVTEVWCQKTEGRSISSRHKQLTPALRYIWHRDLENNLHEATPFKPAFLKPKAPAWLESTVSW